MKKYKDFGEMFSDMEIEEQEQIMEEELAKEQRQQEDDFDLDEEGEKEQMIEARGVEADPFGWY